MKTYLLDVINRVKRFSQELDVQTILCSKAWYVLNEDGDSEILVFQTDGKVLVTVKGATKLCTWQYIPQNKSIHIMHNDTDGTMFKPAFLDGTVLAFNQIGTNECMFLIDDEMAPENKLLSLNTVKQYLENIEHKAIAEQKQREKKLRDEQKREKLAIQSKKEELERRRKQLLKRHQAELAQLDKDGCVKWAQVLELDAALSDGMAVFVLMFPGLISVPVVVAGGYLTLHLLLSIEIEIQSLHIILQSVLSILFFALIIVGGLLMGFLAHMPLMACLIKLVGYKKAKKSYKQYVQETGDKLDKFNFSVFRDIEDSYLSYKNKREDMLLRHQHELEEIE